MPRSVPNHNRGVVVAYGGVHQAYQIALGAQEAACLVRFLCSFFDGPGKWGRLLGVLLGREAMRNRRLSGIPTAKITEFPWPELCYKLRQRLLSTPGNAWIDAAHAFDRWASQQVPKLESQVIVCSENCARHTFQAAASLGWRRIYDCPGCNTQALENVTREAARLCRLPFVSVADTPEVAQQKEEEIALADVVLTYSEFHAAGLLARGVPKEKIVIIPLWTDPSFWTPGGPCESTSNRLRVIFAGGINLRKGVPFLIEAGRKLVPRVKLTLVGSLDPDARTSLMATDDFATVIPPVSKSRLRDLFRAHDILVLPSLGDSFGFVALEAMACGLPVVVTENCGVPVPDPGWRVPVMDAKAISGRLEFYADNRCALRDDGERAFQFARQFTPNRYRVEIGKLLRSLLGP